MNPLVQLHSFGQSFWYDNMRRAYLEDGTIQALIDEDGLRGITSNPSIFQKAIGGSDDYDEAIKQLVAEGADTNTIYETLAVADIQAACDMFAPLYAQSGRGDGYVSLEVSPYLAHDTAGTVTEAKRLWGMVDRPNLMIKIPATTAGIPAIQQVIGSGINVNVTLMFNMAHYEAVAGAYIDGLNDLIAAGGDPSTVASVASFFVSRVDTAVDNVLDEKGNSDLLGKIAVANCKVVYQAYKALFHGEAFGSLREAGANVQRLLWASTSTKNPAYPDTLYVDTLIGKKTVNTMPPKTIDAFRDHGTAADVLEEGAAEAQQMLDQFAALGGDLDGITEALQAAGVDSFSKSFDTLMESIETEAYKYRTSTAN